MNDPLIKRNLRYDLLVAAGPTHPGPLPTAIT
jgi:hypothetical protein